MDEAQCRRSDGPLGVRRFGVPAHAAPRRPLAHRPDRCCSHRPRRQACMGGRLFAAHDGRWPPRRRADRPRRHLLLREQRLSDRLRRLPLRLLRRGQRGVRDTLLSARHLSVACDGGGSHGRIKALAYVFMALWPIGVLVLYRRCSCRVAPACAPTLPTRSPGQHASCTASTRRPILTGRWWSCCGGRCWWGTCC